MIMITKNQILKAHDQMINLTGGIYGVRDEGLLDSALGNPFQTFSGEELYPSTISKISMVCYSLIKNHPFVDGNKRTGMLVLLVLLDINDIDIEFTDDEIVEMGLSIASGKVSHDDLQAWLLKHI